MWKGTITTHDNALQLLLLVDYVCDWARDIYRPAILRELRVLADANNDVTTVITETDIFSIRERVARIITNTDPFSTMEGVAPLIDLTIEESDEHAQLIENETLFAHQRLDNRFGAVRNASLIQSRFLCIFITADNIQTFLKSIDRDIRRHFMRKVLKSFLKTTSYLITVDTLNKIEKVWSGHSRSSLPFNARNLRLHTMFRFNYYFSPKWEQVRDLCVIAMAEDALDTFPFHQVLESGVIHLRELKYEHVHDDAVVDGVKKIWNIPVRGNLQAAVSRVSSNLCVYDSITQPKDNPWMPCNAKIWGLVNYAYKHHLLGDLEPDRPFLRFSKQINIQKVHSTDDGITSEMKSSNSSLPTCFLIHGENSYTESPFTNLCLYVLRNSVDPPSQEEICDLIKTTFENFDVHHTTRHNGYSNIRERRIEEKLWNLQNTYGLYYAHEHSDLFTWLRSMQGALPTRQGSRRGPEDSGRSMFTRNYTPWSDPRYQPDHPELYHKRRTQLGDVVVSEAKSWANISIERRNEGTDCCIICASPRTDERILQTEHTRDENVVRDWEAPQLEGLRDYITRYFKSLLGQMCELCERDTDVKAEHGMLYGTVCDLKFWVMQGNMEGLTTGTGSEVALTEPQSDTIASEDQTSSDAPRKRSRLN